MNANELKPGIIVRGPVLPEPIEVLVVTPLGDVIKIVGAGQKTGQVHQRVLRPDQLQFLEATPEHEPFDGDPARFRLGVEATRLGLAYEYDPYFSLSISRVDPLPHQLEAVYDYFMRLPRIRFLLADDPGAGKTIMAGLLLKELKIRGLVKRTLIVAPANLCFQWQRELKEKFRESFEVVRSDMLRANYGQNPWQEKNQLITSISWVSRIEDARESLLRSRWDLVIVDEAHKMAAYSADKKTLAYKLGEALSTVTDHYLLMTATPHKGDPENFCLFLELLDRDIYGSVKSLEEAMRRHHAPFYLRRTKEAFVSFPDPETGEVKKLFTKREVRTASFELDGDEYDFYDALTRYVEDQSIKASEDESARGRAVSFTMAMLQRRFASSVYAVRRSLERMRDKRQKILADPEKYRKDQIEDRLPEDFDDLPEDEQMEIEAALEGVVASIDPIALREEIQRLGKLIEQGRALEGREIESKLVKLRKVLSDNNVFNDPTMKLLIFTEHKDTLDYLAGDGKDGRPLGRLRQWGLKTTQIHGGMKIGDRDTPGSRIHAERGRAGARDRDLPAPDHPEAGGARRGGANARGIAVPAFRGRGPGVLRHVAGWARADATRRGGASGSALALGEVSLADAVAGADLPGDRRRRRRHEGPGHARRGGAGNRLVHLPGRPRAPALRDDDRRGARGGRRARDQDQVRSGGEPIHRPRGVSERMGGPDGAPDRPGRPRGPRRTRLDPAGDSQGPGRRATHRAVPHQPATPGRQTCPLAPRASEGVREPLTSPRG
jgi:superfamily II DNA or RNA helicase